MNIPAGVPLSLDIYKLAKVPRRQLELLPDVGGLYFALDGAQRVWYIGQATSLKTRLLTHEKASQFHDCDGKRSANPSLANSLKLG